MLEQSDSVTGSAQFDATLLSAFAEMRRLLLTIETDLGLTGLSRVERDMLHACHDICDAQGSFLTSDLRGHRLMAGIAPATFHRALKRLMEGEHVRHAPDRVTKRYLLSRR